MRDILLWIANLFFLVSQVAAESQLHRHHDDRPMVNVQQAETNGILRYESQRMILFTDIDPEIANQLVTLVDQIFPTWEAQLGVLPEARDKSEFQITGYLMHDPDKFRKAGLHPKSLTTVLHGQNDGYEFWMHDQEWDYYRTHLLLHEATHCVTQCRDGEDEQRPLWFLEGMAEYFGTHQLIEQKSTSQQQLQFGVIPKSAEAAHGFGRIEMIRAECEAGRALSAAEVLQLGSKEFSVSRTTPYAWSWALSHFLTTHPATAEDYRNVCHQWDTTNFKLEFQKFWNQHEPVITPDWELFRESICYGFDVPRGATLRGEVAPLEQGARRDLKVSADRGWQSTGLTVRAGQSIQLNASGRVVLGTTTKPWESEPQGISVRYSEGRPIGRLLAAVQRSTPAESGPIPHWVYLDLANGAEVKSPESGVLFLRINDRWNELSDNSGEYRVNITAPN